MRSIYLFGTPGVGKSTIVRGFMQQTGSWVYKEPAKLVRIHVHEEGKVAIIGNYSEEDQRYPGVDRMAMNSQPRVEAYLGAMLSGPVPRLVICEGDRFSNRKFFNFLADTVTARRAKFVRIVANSELIRQRQVLRGDDRTAGFLASRETKYRNLESCFQVERWTNDGNVNDLVHKLIGLVYAS